MKVLITGAGSYIGNAFKNHLEASGCQVAVLDMTDPKWTDYNFSGFDSVFHVAGIVHLKEKKKNKQLYFDINAGLAAQTAVKAKEAGVKQFIFISSMSVYGKYKNINITADTPLKPQGYYGESKLQAETMLLELETDCFKIAIIRPPMVFGKDCKGNFPRLIKLSSKLPFFPNIKNQRSMLHIDNLCEFVKLLIESGKSGLYFPQNTDYFCTTELTVALAAEKRKKLKTTRLFNWLIWLSFPFLGTVKKLFGNLTYDKALSCHFENAYNIKNNSDSIKDSV